MSLLDDTNRIRVTHQVVRIPCQLNPSKTPPPTAAERQCMVQAISTLLGAAHRTRMRPICAFVTFAPESDMERGVRDIWQARPDSRTMQWLVGLSIMGQPHGILPLTTRPCDHGPYLVLAMLF
jgi:hypothetical protein